MAPVPRTWSAAFFDKLFSWYYFGLPWEQCSYTVERHHIPLADGIELAADLYRPVLRAGATPVGTLLVRTAYGLGFPSNMAWGRPFAARGYQVLAVASRGTAGSTGQFYPMRHEVEDGPVVLAWMRKQEWYTGSFATLGGSYLGFTQWTLLAESQPDDYKAAVIESGIHDFGLTIWGTGALNPVFIAWSVLMNPVYRGAQGPPSVFPTDETLKPIADSAPLFPDAIDTLFKNEPPPWLEGVVTRPNQSDPFWVDFRSGNSLNNANIPILLFTGWYDFVLPQVLEQYTTLSKRGVTVALTIGPWNHLEAQRLTKREAWDWLEEHFTRRKGRRRSAPVRVFVTGAAKQWRDLAAWPPLPPPGVGSTTHELYLRPNGVLTPAKPPAEAPDSVFTFDPANPTPAVGTPLFTRMDGGKDNDASLAERSDVLAFTLFALLENDLEVLGRPTVELYHTTNTPYADLLVRLCDVDSKGISHNVAERFLRLPEKSQQQPLQVELSDCAHKFAKGNKIRVVVAGGSHPQYLRNFGTGEPQATAKDMKPVVHTVRHNDGAVSRVSLPISVPGS